MERNELIGDDADNDDRMVSEGSPGLLFNFK